MKQKKKERKRRGKKPRIRFYEYLPIYHLKNCRVPQCLDNYEAQETYTLEFVTPEIAIRKNRSVTGSPYNPIMLEREAKVLEILIAEGVVD